ncbi:MAG TPA: hypothetical protein VFV08_05220, partial [Puia sp.]|nr:hypothetical protein [Puia sp.]
MKKRILGTLLILSIVISILFSCKKSVESMNGNPNPTGNGNDTTHNNTQTTGIQSVPYPQSPIMGCSYGPDYGDSLVYVQPSTGQDYIINP